MAWFWNRDRSSDTAPVQITPTQPVQSFSEKMTHWMESLSWSVKQSSDVLSAEVYSELRGINDTLEKIRVFLQTHPVRAEQEYIIESTLTNYIPSALTIFNQLPANAQVTGGAADKLLLSQCRSVSHNINQLNAELQGTVMSNLTTHTRFMEERLSSSL